MDIIDRCRDQYERQGLNKSQIASVMNISRGTVRKYLNGAEEGYHRKNDIPRPLYNSIFPIIEKWLEEDKSAPRKQRRTRKKIHEELSAYSGQISHVIRFKTSHPIRMKTSPKKAHQKIQKQV